MTTNINPARGLELYGERKAKPVVADIDSGNTVPLFPGSVVYLVAGKIRGLPDAGGGAVSNGQAIKGRLEVIRDTHGKTLQNIAAATAGVGEYTDDPDQLYQIPVSGVQYADADAGKMYNFTFESHTADTATADGDAVSSVKLLGSSENANTRNFVVFGRVTGMTDNTAGVDGVMVYGKINPVNYQTGVA